MLLLEVPMREDAVPLMLVLTGGVSGALDCDVGGVGGIVNAPGDVGAGDVPIQAGDVGVSGAAIDA